MNELLRTEIPISSWVNIFFKLTYSTPQTPSIWFDKKVWSTGFVLFVSNFWEEHVLALLYLLVGLISRSSSSAWCYHIFIHPKMETRHCSQTQNDLVTVCYSMERVDHLRRGSFHRVKSRTWLNASSSRSEVIMTTKIELSSVCDSSQAG